MKKLLSTMTAVILLLSAPALANNCPNLMKKIDAAVASSPWIDKELLGHIVKLREQGEKMHIAGRHGRAERRLKMALKIYDQAVEEAAKNGKNGKNGKD